MTWVQVAPAVVEYLTEKAAGLSPLKTSWTSIRALIGPNESLTCPSPMAPPVELKLAKLAAVGAWAS